MLLDIHLTGDRTATFIISAHKLLRCTGPYCYFIMHMRQ
jgi:hypothetical protein